MALESIGSRNDYSVSKVNQTTPVPEIPAVKEVTADATIKAPVIKTENNASQDQQTRQNGGEGTDTAQLSLEQVKKAIDTINKNANNSTIQFGVHEATNRITIKIVDKDTQKVIREVPAEKTLDMIAKAWEMAGILVDEKR